MRRSLTTLIAAVPLVAAVAGCSSSASPEPAPPAPTSPSPSAPAASAVADAAAYCPPLQEAQQATGTSPEQMAATAAAYQAAVEPLRAAGLNAYADYTAAVAARWEFMAEHPDPEEIVNDPALVAEDKALTEALMVDQAGMEEQYTAVMETCELATGFESSTDLDSGETDITVGSPTPAP